MNKNTDSKKPSQMRTDTPEPNEEAKINKPVNLTANRSFQPA